MSITDGDTMLKIGEFAKLCGASVQTLRYYDEVGVLCADSIDPDSGYRYYRPEQAETFRSIALFKEIGFSLDEIRLLMRGSEDENSRQFNKKREALIMEMRRMRLMVSRLDAMVSEPERTRRRLEHVPFADDPADARIIPSSGRAGFCIAPEQNRRMVSKIHTAS